MQKLFAECADYTPSKGTRGSLSQKLTVARGAILYFMTSKIQRISKFVVIGAIAILFLWDCYAQIAGGTEATISRAVWDFSKTNPFVVFLAGFVAGHLWWQSPRGICPVCGHE